MQSHLNVIIPTNLGTINVYCYSSESKFAENKESFKKFVNSIILFPDIKYEPNFLRDNPFLNDVIYEGKYVNILLLITMGILFSRRIKSKRDVK